MKNGKSTRGGGRSGGFIGRGYYWFIDAVSPTRSTPPPLPCHLHGPNRITKSIVFHSASWPFGTSEGTSDLNSPRALADSPPYQTEEFSATHGLESWVPHLAPTSPPPPWGVATPTKLSGGPV